MNKKFLGIIFIFVVLVVVSGCRMKENASEQKTDDISGYSWEAKDGSLLCLDEDGSFNWYRYANDRNNSYYTGTYSVYNGEKAVDFISTELSEYYVTRKQQTDMISSVEDASIETYYCIVLNNEKCIVDGKNTLREGNVSPLYGFYYADNEFLDLVNLKTENYYQFTRYSE